MAEIGRWGVMPKKISKKSVFEAVLIVSIKDGVVLNRLEKIWTIYKSWGIYKVSKGSGEQ